MESTNCMNSKCKELIVLGEGTTHYYGCAKDVEDWDKCSKIHIRGRKINRDFRKELMSIIANDVSDFLSIKNPRSVRIYSMKIIDKVLKYFKEHYDEFYFIDRKWDE